MSIDLAAYYMARIHAGSEFGLYIWKLSPRSQSEEQKASRIRGCYSDSNVKAKCYPQSRAQSLSFDYDVLALYDMGEVIAIQKVLHHADVFETITHLIFSFIALFEKRYILTI